MFTVLASSSGEEQLPHSSSPPYLPTRNASLTVSLFSPTKLLYFPNFSRVLFSVLSLPFIRSILLAV